MREKEREIGKERVREKHILATDSSHMPDHILVILWDAYFRRRDVRHFVTTEVLNIRTHRQLSTIHNAKSLLRS
jgi:hypothetical protein